MPDTSGENLRDCAIITLISVFGISYFFLFAVQYLIFHFPPTPADIVGTLSVIFFAFGVIGWYLLCLSYRVIASFHEDQAACWQRLEFGGVLLLIWTTTLPTVVLLFPTQPFLQLGYLAMFSLVFVGSLVDLFMYDPSIAMIRVRFPYYCASLGILALVPMIHSFTESPHAAPELAIAFGRMAMMNTMGAVFYLLRPLERTGLVPGWQPSLYMMHFVLAYSAFQYSQAIVQSLI
jgi:predicted membrane channel-forming protein YqfA (hemolysin III family)